MERLDHGRHVVVDRACSALGSPRAQVLRHAKAPWEDHGVEICHLLGKIAQGADRPSRDPGTLLKHVTGGLVLSSGGVVDCMHLLLVGRKTGDLASKAAEMDQGSDRLRCIVSVVYTVAAQNHCDAAGWLQAGGEAPDEPVLE